MIVPAETGVEPGSQGVAVAMTTNELAAHLGIVPQSLLHRYCITGSYFGIRPQKLPNRRLIWPADSIKRLMETRQEAPKQEADHVPA